MISASSSLRTAAGPWKKRLVAKATSPGVLIAAVVVTALICHRRGRSLEAVVLVAATGLAYLTGAIAKYTLHRPRPVAPINLAPDSEPSYPSGHVLVIATVALVGLALAWRYLDRRRRILAAIIAIWGFRRSKPKG